MLNQFMHRLRYAAVEGLNARQSRIYNFLLANPTAIISSVGQQQPHGAVIYFSIDKKFSIFFLTKNSTQKYKNIVHNPQVMLTVYQPLTQTVVQVKGTAYELMDAPAINSVAAAIVGVSMKLNDGALPPISKLQAGSYAAFRIDPVQITMASYATPAVGGYEDLFETIESFDLKEDY